MKVKHLLQLSDEEFENYDLPNKKILLINLEKKLDYHYHIEIPY
jgi:bisphosphoglycerate-dependent phosphoglycerate mutase